MVQYVGYMLLLLHFIYIVMILGTWPTLYDG